MTHHGLDDDTARAYAGQWIALLRGRIVAHGATREQAEIAARRFRFKEIPEILYMPPVSELNNSPILRTVRDALPENQPIYLVGGAVRDALLGRESHDLDFAVPSGAMALARQIANRLGAAYFPLDESNDTGRIVLTRPDGQRDTLDFAGFRGPDLTADLRGRDFTINAIAWHVHTGQFHDPLGGNTDLREKRIRACSPASISDDPIRALRALRQAAGLGFSIERETRQWIKESAPALANTSPERVRDELFKILNGPRPEASLRALEMLDLLPYTLPELPALKGVTQTAPHVHDVWNHTLAVLRHLETILSALAPTYNEERANADLLNGLLVLRLGRYRQQIGEHLANELNPERSARALLFFAALYHDSEKPATKTHDGERIRFFGHDEKGALTIGRRAIALRLSNDEIDRAKLIVRHHMRFHFHAKRRADEGKDISRKAIYRFFRDVGPAGVDLALLALADTRATYDHTITQETWSAALDTARTLLEAWYEKSAELVTPPALLNGNDLMEELHLKPGPDLGRLLETIREAQAEGHLTDRAQALAYARGWQAARKLLAN